MDRRAWALALRRPCCDHGAEPGDPCWRSPRAMCGRRARTLGRPTSPRRRKGAA